jgi:hypothetical protein
MEEELEKLYQDLLTNRQIYRGQGLVTASPPQPYQDLINSPTNINYDFASLYPSVQKKYYYKISMKVSIRKRKITNIFQ